MMLMRATIFMLNRILKEMVDEEESDVDNDER
jgi:hypothetical protein